MGIHGLMKLLSEECPDAIKERELDYLTGRKVAIDASMAMYQFLIAVRSSGDGHAATMLTNEAGEVTSHIQGMFNRTIKMLTTGVKPVYVFDGKPPQMKGGELAKRIARRTQAEASLEASKEADDVDDINKFSRRLVKVTRQHNEDCKELLRLMGVPVIDAPCEAEAQCAELAKKGKVYATATEDMDALTFRTPILLRKLTFSGQKQPITEINFEAVLRGLAITYEQFVDLCILCGCDYCSTIKGIGPKTALKLIRQHISLERVVAVLSKDKKYQIPADWKSFTLKEKEEALLAMETADCSNKNKEIDTVVEDMDEDAEVEDEDEDAISLSNGDKDNDKVDADKHDVDEHGAKDTPKEDNLNEVKVMEDEIDKVKEVTVEGEVEDKISSKKEEAVSMAEEGDDVTPVTSISVPIAPSTMEEESPESNIATVDSNVSTDAITNVNVNDVLEPLYAQARQLFLQAEVVPGETLELKWKDPDEEGLRTFLVEKMQFNLERVNNAIKKLKEAQPKQAQQRMDSFFKPMAPSADSAAASKKRKVEPPSKGKAGSKGSWGGAKKR